MTPKHQRWRGGQVGRCPKDSLEYNIISAHHAVARRVRQLSALGWDALGHAAPRPVVAHLGGDEADVDGGDNDEYRHAVPSPVVANSWLITLITLISFSFSYFISFFCSQQP